MRREERGGEKVVCEDWRVGRERMMGEGKGLWVSGLWLVEREREREGELDVQQREERDGRSGFWWL